MEMLETKHKPFLQRHLPFYSRFIDDCFGGFDGTRDECEAFVSQLNKLESSIKFTYEWESFDPSSREATLPFLDLMVHRTPTGPKFGVYHKPTQVHSYLHYMSQHSPSQKRGVMHTLFLRGLRLCSPEYLEQELQILTNAFTNLCYPMSEINRAISVAKTRHLASPDTNTSTNTDSSTLKPLLFPYHRDLSALNPVIREAGYRFIFTSGNTIGKSVVSKRGYNVAASHRESGVYRIPCEETGCHMSYYGRSMQLGKRIAQHSTDLSNKDHTKPLWRHCMDYPGHTFSPAEAARLIWSTRDINLSKIVEAACINTFHSCNRAWPDVSLSYTLSSFITHITGIRGRSKRLAAIEYPTAPNATQNTTPPSPMVDTPGAMLDVSSTQPRMDGPMIGSSTVLQALGSTQHSPIDDNNTALVDQGSLFCTWQRNLSNILGTTPTGPMDETAISSSPSGDDSIINLAFLQAADDERTPTPTDDATQETSRPTASTTASTRGMALSREVRVLLGEAVSFIESTEGEITTTTASQPVPSSRSLPRRPRRIPSSQITNHHVSPSPHVTRNTRSRSNQSCNFKTMF